MAEKLCNLVKSGGGIIKSSLVQWGGANDTYEYIVYDDKVVFLTVNVANVRSTGKLFDVPSSIKPLVNTYQTGGTAGANIGIVGVMTNGEVDVWSTSLSGTSVSFVYIKQ